MIKITRNELINFSNALQKYADVQGSPKFSYAVAKNIYEIEKETQILNKILNIPEAYLEYEKERTELAERLADKDEDGKVKKRKVKVNIRGKLTEQEEYVISDRSGFDGELEKLREKHKDGIEEYNKIIQEQEDLLNEEIDFKVYQVPIEYVPDSITPSEMFSLLHLVKE